MNTCKKGMALLLVLVLMLSVIVPVSAAALPEKNNGVRHELCTALSAQAEAYYTGSYSWEQLSSLSGTPTESSLEAMQSDLYTALQTLMTETQTDSVTYRELTSYWRNTDTQPGYGDASLFYSDCDGTGNNYNREHVWPKSHGSFHEANAGCDLHHLRPTDVRINSTRGNHVMSDVRENNPGCNTAEYNGKTVLWLDSNKVEVADNVKGDVARIMLYVYTRWGQPNLCVDVPRDQLPANDSGSSNDGIRVMDNLDTLLSWCASDPVDTWEMSRNDRVQDVQGNRNVFIDYPELAWLLFGQDVPADMDTPSGNVGSGESQYQVTAVSNNDAWGTTEVQGTRIVCHPAEGYYVADVELVPADGATLIRNGNVLKLNKLTADVTVNVTFAAKTAAKITYLLPEGATAENAVTTGYVGDSVELPAVTGDVSVDGVACRFIGWVKGTVADTTDASALNAYNAGTDYVIEAEHEIFYGLYAYEEASSEGGESTTFHKLTAAPADWSGEYVMAGLKNDALVIHKSNGEDVGGSAGAVELAQTGAVQEGDTLSGVTADYVIAVEKQAEGNYTIQLKGASDPTYLAFYGTKNRLYFKNDPTMGETRWTFSLLENGCVDVESAYVPGRHLQYNADANMFRCYKSGQQDVLLYSAGAPTITHYLTLAEKPAEPVNPFEDVHADDYFYNPVLWAVENKVTSGVDDTHFAPAGICSRKEVVAFLWRAKGRPEPASAVNPFPDVPDGAYYTKAVLWAVENHIISGRTDGTFDPNAPCTRAEVISILWRANGRPAPAAEEIPFTDVEAGRYYTNAVIWAAENKITSGTGNHLFKPYGTCTRGQIVSFLYNRYGK